MQGYGTVRYQTAEAAQAAIQQVHGTDLEVQAPVSIAAFLAMRHHIALRYIAFSQLAVLPLRGTPPICLFFNRKLYLSKIRTSRLGIWFLRAGTNAHRAT